MPDQHAEDSHTGASHAAFTLRNDPARIRAAEEGLIRAARAAGHDRSAAFALRLALEEAVRNAFDHGRAGEPDATIDIAWTVEPERVLIHIDDHGPGFDPAAVADPTDEANLERPCGRGLLLMRAYMSSVKFNEAGNAVTMRYEPTPG